MSGVHDRQGRGREGAGQEAPPIQLEDIYGGACVESSPIRFWGIAPAALHFLGCKTQHNNMDLLLMTSQTN